MSAARSIALPVLVICLTATLVSQEPRNAEDWFSRASDRMTLRMPGSTPFHLRATFHANGGKEYLSSGQKPSIIIGDGVYDEVWLEPHTWRREATLADYHATEVEANGARKMQSTSDYEPSRLWMLLDALLAPVAKSLFAKENGHHGWKIDNVKTGDINVVRISRSTGTQRADYTDSYYFQPTTGVLMMSNAQGLVTLWSGFHAWDNKVVPGQLTVQTADAKVLLEAHINVEPAGHVDPQSFLMEGPSADPGMTLRPLQASDVHMPDLSDSYSWISNQLGPLPVFSVIATLDRHGYFRELEIPLAPNPRDATIIMSHFREMHKKPATIDGSPCQVRVIWMLL